MTRIDNIPRNSMQILQNYDWPGNIRELKNFIERAIIISTGSTLHIELPGTPKIDGGRLQTLDEVQKNHIVQTLESVRWRVRGKNGAAEILSCKPTTLEYKMKKLGIKRPAVQ